METASASSQPHTGSEGGSLQFPRTEEGEGPGGEELDDELMFDVDADLEADDRNERSPGASRHRNRRARFLPCLSRAKAYIGEVDDSIADNHLQHGLKRHLFA